MKSVTKKVSKAIFTGEALQLEIERDLSTDEITYSIRENVGADPQNPTFKTRFQGTTTEAELLEIKAGITEIINANKP